MVLAGAGLLREGYRKHRRTDRIERTDPTPIGDLEPGDAPVDVTGTARPVTATFTAEIADAEAIVVRTEVTTGIGRQRESRGTHLQRRPFVVEDGTGTATVDPGENTNFDLTAAETTLDPNERRPMHLARHLRAVEYDDFENRNLGFRQGTIEPGEEVYVHATATEAASGWNDADVVLTDDPDGEAAVVSDRSESSVLTRTKWSGLDDYLSGAFLIALGAWIAAYPLT